MSKKASKQESKEVVPVTTSTAVAAPKGPVDLGAWGVHEQQLTSRDIIIPKILAQQAMSKAVTAGAAKFGEFRESLNGVIMGDTTNPIEFLPFYMEKVFVVMKEDKSKFVFSKQVPITPELENHEYECLGANNVKERWYRAMNFYVLLPKEIEAGKATPYMLCFRSSSARAGQTIATTMYMRNLKAGKTPASMVMELSGEKTTNDKGTFIVMTAKEKRETTDAELEQAFEWVKTVRAGQVRVDHSDLEDEATQGAPAAPESTQF